MIRTAEFLREGPIRKMLREGIRGEAAESHDTVLETRFWWSHLEDPVSEALATAMKQVTSQTDRRVAIQEFWHSLNRKGVVRNDEVQSLIDLSILESGRR